MLILNSSLYLFFYSSTVLCYCSSLCIHPLKRIYSREVYTNINENKLWIENYLEIFNSKKTIFINNYKEVFLRLKKLLRFGDFQDKYNALIMTKKLVYHYFLNQSNEFDFISSFNTIIEDLMIFLGSNVKFNRNLEYSSENSWEDIFKVY